MAKDKRFWAHVVAGTVAVIAIIFSAKQCGDRKEAEALNREAATALRDQQKKIEDLQKEVDDIDQENIALRDTIGARDARIISLQDSLAICREGNACPCTGDAVCNCKKSKNGCNTCPCCKPKPKPKKKPVPVKPAPKKNCNPAPAKPAPAKPAPKKDCDQGNATVVVQSGDKKVVVKDQDKAPTQSVIINGDNNGNVIVNQNGIVEANGNVNGHDNNVNSNSAAARRKQMMQGCQTTTTVVMGSRSRCR